MKRAIRMLILVVGLVGVYEAVAATVPAPDGGPLPMCNPKTTKKCV
jgi:hypothetical protein